MLPHHALSFPPPFPSTTTTTTPSTAVYHLLHHCPPTPLTSKHDRHARRHGQDKPTCQPCHHVTTHNDMKNQPQVVENMANAMGKTPRGQSTTGGVYKVHLLFCFFIIHF